MRFSTLPDNQREILDIIASHIRINGESPSLRDILKQTSKINSLRGVAIQLMALEEAGFITRSSEAKSIEINEALWGHKDELVEIPLFTNCVQAGEPAFFDEYSDSSIPVMLSATRGLRNVYAFKVKGDSMIGLDIADGDFAIVTTQVQARDGDVVIASTESGITLKTYRVIDGHPLLFPSNKHYKPIADGFEIKGKLVNIIKPQMIAHYKRLKSYI